MNESKILIVEDEGITAMEIMQILQSKGYESYIAFSGKDAIEKAQKMKPDLILMDIKLNEEFDGIKTVIKINEIMDVPVIYLTACTDKETLKSVELTKPCAYVFKPFDEDELIESIETALNKDIGLLKII